MGEIWTEVPHPDILRHATPEYINNRKDFYRKGLELFSTIEEQLEKISGKNVMRKAQ